MFSKLWQTVSIDSLRRSEEQRNNSLFTCVIMLSADKAEGTYANHPPGVRAT
jgi:hypothetical protein